MRVLRHRLAWLASLLLGVLWACFVFWIPIAFFLLDLSPSNPFEESVGYRYFYSLRNTFGGEFPWLPQGHLPNLVHAAIQYLLDLLGFLHSDLGARIDLFSFLAVLAPLLLSTSAAGLLFARSGNSPLVITATFASALILLLPPTPNGWTVMPDYHVWVVPLALVAMVLLTDPYEGPADGFAVAVGMFAAIALAIKLTFLAFAIPLTGLLLQRMLQSRRSLRCFVEALLAFSCVLAVILAAYFPDVATSADWIDKFRLFISSQANTLPTSTTVWDGIMSHPYLLVVVMAQIAVALAGLIRHRFDLVALALGALLQLAFLMQRFYSHSFIELHAYLFLEVGTLLMWGTRLTAVRRRQQWAAGAVAFTAVLTIVIGWNALWRQPMSLLAYSRTMQELSAAFDQRLRARADSFWILTTGNAYRPNSIHSALCKGGMDVFYPYWGVSHYVSTLFSSFHCAVVPNGVAQRDLTASSVGFLRYSDEEISSAIRRVEEYFTVSLAERRCTDLHIHAFGYVVCDPPKLENGTRGS